MTALTRRTLLSGAAAAGAATLTPAMSSSAQAAAPLSGQQAAGWYRYKVGDIEVTVATDGVNRFKFPDGFITNQGRDQVNAALSAAYLQPAPDMIAIPYSPIVGEHRLQTRRDRHRHRRGQLQEQQGRRRPVPWQPEGVGHRPQSRSTS